MIDRHEIALVLVLLPRGNEHLQSISCGLDVLADLDDVFGVEQLLEDFSALTQLQAHVLVDPQHDVYVGESSARNEARLCLVLVLNSQE